MPQPLTIGQAARATGVAAKTIRYYEQIGVLPAPSRSAAGYRQYDLPGVERLRFIRRARALRLPLRRLKHLTEGLNGASPGGEVRRRLLALVQAQLAAIDHQLAELEGLRRQLEQVSRRMRTSRRGHRSGPCRCLDPEKGSATSSRLHRRPRGRFSPPP